MHTSTITIAVNKKANFDYFIEEKLQAGIVLEGWEVKSLRSGRVQLRDGYVLVKGGEVFLLNAHISPLPTVSTHIQAEPLRTRKLLLQRRQIDRLLGSTERKGYTLVPLKVFWSGAHVKVEIGLAKGKKQFDKRASEKDKAWAREKQRLFKALH